jgi:hypothetical protein
MSRYRSDEARAWLWDEGDRTCLKWRSGDYWDDIRVSLKAYFPRHADLSYNARRKLWSVHGWWVRALHPDTGHGDTARMAGINAAVDTIKEDGERKAPCAHHRPQEGRRPRQRPQVAAHQRDVGGGQRHVGPATP